MKVRYNTLTLSGGQTTTVEKYIQHESHYELQYDIGLIKTSAPMPLSQQNCDKINLPDQGSDPTPGTMINITGWGATSTSSRELSENLQIAELPIINRTDCQKIYENDVTINQFCAMKDGVDACTGDAGGPAASNKVLLGIISWGGEECAQQGKPGVYTNVGQFVDWINSKMNEESS